MAAQKTTPKPESPSPPRKSISAADIIARIAMGLAAAALFVGLYMQFDMAFWLAITAALSTYIALVLVHAYVRRSDQVTELTSELTELRAEVERLKITTHARAPGSSDPAHPSLQAGAGSRGHLLGAASSGPAASTGSSSGAPSLETFRPRDFARDFASAMAVKKPAPVVVPKPLSASDERLEAPPVGPPQNPPPSGPSDMQDYWSFRPAASPDLAVAGGPRPSLHAVASPFAVERGATIVAPPSDLEFLQEQIKKLADTVNAAEAAIPPSRPMSMPVEPTPMPVAAAPVSVAEGAIREEAIDQSVKALRSASHSMRGESAEFTLPAVSPPAVVLASMPPDEARYEVIAATPGPFDLLPATLEVIASSPAVDPIADKLFGVAIESVVSPPTLTPTPHPVDQTEALGTAVAAGNLDVFLEPILGLGHQRAEHYELTVQIRDGVGGPVAARDAAALLLGTDILTAFEVAKFERTTLIAGRIAAKGKSGSLFSEFSGAALSADAFLSAFSDAYDAQPRIGQQLVLSFTQASIRGFAEPEWMTLTEMSEYGFRFAVADVTDLDMDFAGLSAKGFRYVKLDQDVFLDGLPVENTSVPAQDLCRHFAGLGQTIIVGGIDDGAKHAQIFGLGVLLGQGQLFGGPRPVKADVLKAPANAAA